MLTNYDFKQENKVDRVHCIFTVAHIHTSELLSAALLEALSVEEELQLVYCLHVVYLVGEVVAVYLIAVGLTSWTLNLDAMALQDGCFFKNTNLIIAYRPQTATTHSEASKQQRKVTMREFRRCSFTGVCDEQGGI